MNVSFLEKTAQHLIENYPDNFSDLCIVLPNKRASLFLKQHISKLIDQPIWLPQIIGTEELIEQLSETEIIDNVTQLFELYLVYKNNTKEPETFDEFSKWGQILLHDFNEIDRYLVPTNTLFKHINEVRALEVWNLGEGEITEFQNQYLKFWKQLGELYQFYTQHLIKNELAYQGLAYRIVAEKLKENPEQFIKEKIKADKLIFVGFNALNKAEEVLITELKKQGKCEVLFDADEYYMNDTIQESGMFLRKFKDKEAFQPFKWVTDKFKTEQKQINIYGVPQNVGQAKYLTTIINQLNNEKNYTDTAVVLADENLLIPVLQSIPENIENINVTMGYPLKNTSLNNFFEIYFATLVNAERFGHNGQLTYHHKDFLKLFQLPFSKIVFTPEICSVITNHIVKHNWIFINKEKLDWINEKLPIALMETYTIAVVLKQCLSFIEIGKQHFIANKSEQINTTIELEYLFQYAKLFNQIITLTNKYPFIENIKGFYSQYYQILSAYSIELYGEPLKGLQVLGMLETRNIDFKNIILLSANEGVLPAGKSFNSFIPFDVKMAYDLPTHIEKDAVYAYHFYRLIQNASNITIIYNTETSEFGSGEQSRYITQIENELPLYNPAIKIDRKLVVYPTNDVFIETKEVKKTPQIIAKIKERFKDGFSPSALATYLECPLNFYYNYVIDAKEADEVEEEIEMSSFGTFVHNALEILYQPFIGKNITEHDLKQLLKNADEAVINAFVEEKFTLNELKRGKNLLTLTVAQNYVKTFITNELELVKGKPDKLYIKALEYSLNATIKVGGEDVRLKGKADRIDEFERVLRIIDYKTGKVEKADLKVENIELLSESKKAKAFQVLMYALMYSKHNDISKTTLHSGIISFRKLSEGFMPFGVGTSRQVPNNEITLDVLNEFEEVLVEIIEEIFDESISFKHEADAQWCKFCD